MRLLWTRLPVVVRAAILGIGLAASGTLPWAAIAGANLRYWTVVPWAVPPAALFLWLWWKFAARRPASLRAHDVPDEVWGAALVAGILGIGGSLLILDITNRFVTLPAQPISPELTQVPVTTFLPLHLMGSLVAGVVEEASIRGYMQGAIERRHGAVVAILVTSLLFGLLHFTHPGFLAMMPFYVAVGATYGTLAYLSNSILPGMVLHAGGDAMGGLMVLAQGQSVSTQPIPVPLGGTDFDAAFWIACVALLIVGGATVWAFTGLAALRAAALVCVLLSIGCGGGSVTGPDDPAVGTGRGTFVLRAPPVDPAVVDFILPLGNLNPPGHTFPTDHIYFYVGFLRPEHRAVPVFVPGDGTVQSILRGGAPDVKILIRAAGTLSYYVDHVVLEPGIREGMVLMAGQRLGTSGTGGFGIDLGVIDSARTLSGFVNPARYSFETIHADAPLKYYEEPVRSQLYAMVRREGADRDGRIDFDVAGRLVGNWFLEGLSIAESSQPAGWPKHLAFVFDNVQPTEPRISIGGTLPLTGAYTVDAGAPAFVDVTPASGLIAYRLRVGGSLGGLPGPQAGTLLAQMLDASRVRVEVVPGSGAPPTSFSSDARIYTR